MSETKLTIYHIIPSVDEIISELTYSLKEKGWHVVADADGPIHIDLPDKVHCVIGRDGTLAVIPNDTSYFFTPFELDAISTACNEIAENY